MQYKSRAAKAGALKLKPARSQTPNASRLKRARVRQERGAARKAASEAANDKRAEAARRNAAELKAEATVKMPERVRRALLAALMAGDDRPVVGVIDLACQLTKGGVMVWAGQRDEWAKQRNAAVLTEA